MTFTNNLSLFLFGILRSELQVEDSQVLQLTMAGRKKCARKEPEGTFSLHTEKRGRDNRSEK